ncbi:Uncharacterized protein TCM_009465 [Theobroma cacao]|uniref:Uncharacterized protein n=1 Tax=Theobroma cacao TaxID=3641 RepID=A0A061E4V7_THECC|nr:Uncharacterized protein TCM_009465 [Theobroma cacao]
MTTYAFIRYRIVEELQRAIRYGQNVKLKGRHLKPANAPTTKQVKNIWNKEVDGIIVDIEEDEIEWLKRSTIESLKPLISYQQLQSSLMHEGIIATVRPSGGLNVIVTFNETKDMDGTLVKQVAMLGRRFEKIQHYNLKELPAHL